MNDDLQFAKLDEYLKQWRRNRQCCQAIDRKFPDWQITVAFYTALHAINAAAAHLGEKPCDHMQRNALVKSNQAFASVRVKYLRLYRLSRFTRYDPDPDAWLPPEYLNVQTVIDDLLTPIENQIQTLIGRNLNLPGFKVAD